MLQSRERRRPPPPFRVVKLSFNNLDRILKIERLADRPFAPEPSRRTIAQVGQDLKGVGLNVTATRPVGFNVQRQRCDSCIVVGVLIMIANLFSTLTQDALG